MKKMTRYNRGLLELRRIMDFKDQLDFEDNVYDFDNHKEYSFSCFSASALIKKLKNV